jgi:FkbM family methyltransferase
MNRAELLQRGRRVLLNNHLTQSVVREGVRKGYLPKPFYMHIPFAGPHPFLTPQGNTVTFTGYEQAGFLWELVCPTGGWEATTLRIFSEMAQTSDTVLDVGAFVGIYTLVAAADSSASVVTFEPNQQILPSLRRNISENGFADRVRVIEAAASDRNGDARFTVPPDDWSMASISSDKDQGDAEVSLVTIDEMIGTEVPVDLIKMDVEGAEEAALRGAEQVFKRCRPTLIVEILTDDSFRAIQDLLRSWGYAKIWHLGPAGVIPTNVFVEDVGDKNYLFKP